MLALFKDPKREDPKAGKTFKHATSPGLRTSASAENEVHIAENGDEDASRFIGSRLTGPNQKIEHHVLRSRGKREMG